MEDIQKGSSLEATGEIYTGEHREVSETEIEKVLNKTLKKKKVKVQKPKKPIRLP